MNSNHELKLVTVKQAHTCEGMRHPRRLTLEIGLEVEDLSLKIDF